MSNNDASENKKAGLTTPFGTRSMTSSTHATSVLNTFSFPWYPFKNYCQILSFKTSYVITVCQYLFVSFHDKCHKLRLLNAEWQDD
jgi:hypothetical protein